MALRLEEDVGAVQCGDQLFSLPLKRCIKQQLLSTGEGSRHMFEEDSSSCRDGLWLE